MSLFRYSDHVRSFGAFFDHFWPLLANFGPKVKIVVNWSYDHSKQSQDKQKSDGYSPVLKINDHATGGRRTKDILGGPKGWGPKKKVADVEIYVIFEVFAFCGGRTKTDFKDRVAELCHGTCFSKVLPVS